MSGRALFIAGAKTGPELNAGVRDCEKIYKVLAEARFGGFDPSLSAPLLSNCATITHYFAALNDFLAKSAEAVQRVIYFTGHGRVNAGTYGLVFGDEFLPFGVVTSMLLGRRPARTLFILDSCHSGAADLGGIKSEPLPIHAGGSALFASSRDIQFSHEDPHLGSLFTHYLCECIESGNGGARTTGALITIPEAAEYIKRKIVKDGRSQQDPLYNINNADGHIWIAKNISGAAHQEGAPINLEPVNDSMSGPCVGATLNDLDTDLLTNYARDNLSVELVAIDAIVEQFELCPPGHRLTPSKAAVLCFGRKPSRYFPEAASVFSAGDRAADSFTRSSVDGPLLRQLQELVQLTVREMRTTAHFDESQVRSDVPEIPVSVLREVIANALAHRDFECAGRVQIHVSADVVEVSNPGSVPEGHTWAELLETPGLTLTSNRRLANLLQTVGGYEGMGRGFSVLQQFRLQRGDEAVTIDQRNKTVVCKLRRPPVEPTGGTTDEHVPVQRMREFVIERAKALAFNRGLFGGEIAQIYVEPELKTVSGRATTSGELAKTILSPSAEIILIGGAGSGKTTLLRHLYQQLSDVADKELSSGASGNGALARIPIFVSLRLIDPDLPLAVAIASNLGVEYGFLETIFVQKNPIIIFDGLDECISSERSAILSSIQSLRDQWRKVSTLISLRPIEGLRSNRDAFIFVLHGLSRDSARLFLDRQLDPNRSTLFWKTFGSDEAIFTNPLLLQLAMHNFEQYGSRPSRMDDLIATAADALWYRHDSTKGSYKRHRHTQLKVDTEKYILGMLALFVIARNVFVASRGDILEVIAQIVRGEHVHDPTVVGTRARDILNDLVEIGFLYIDGEEVGFAHRAFLEHFALNAASRMDLDGEDFARILLVLLDYGITAERLTEVIVSWPSLERETKSLRRALENAQPTGLHSRGALIGMVDSALEKKGKRSRSKDISDLLGGN